MNGTPIQPPYPTYRALLTRPCKNVLYCFTPCKSSDSFRHMFVSNYIVDMGVMSARTSESHKNAPLYLFSSQQDLIHDGIQIYENISPKQKASICNIYGKQLSYKDIMDYAYGLLYHEPYTTKFYECMRHAVHIPYTKHYDTFDKLRHLGNELINTHLLADDILTSAPPVHHLFTTTNDTTVKFTNKHDSTTNTLHINDSLHFIDITSDIYNYTIGSYRVLSKYLNSYKHEPLDISHFTNIIKTIKTALQLESQINQIPLDLIMET